MKCKPSKPKSYSKGGAVRGYGAARKPKGDNPAAVKLHPNHPATCGHKK